jgi:hypothetical protein
MDLDQAFPKWPSNPINSPMQGSHASIQSRCTRITRLVQHIALRDLQSPCHRHDSIFNPLANCIVLQSIVLCLQFFQSVGRPPKRIETSTKGMNLDLKRSNWSLTDFGGIQRARQLGCRARRALHQSEVSPGIQVCTKAFSPDDFCRRFPHSHIFVWVWEELILHEEELILQGYMHYFRNCS